MHSLRGFTGAGPVGKHTSAAASSSEIVEGCLVVKVLQQKQVSFLAVSEISSTRSQNAQKCGASVVLNPIKDDVVKACLDATNGAGVDVVFECAGVQAALDVAFKAVRRRGTVMNIAIWEPNNAARLNPTVLVTKEINFTGRSHRRSAG
jgi:threonine dehydrogenase-like Zn-dependent dehydrogenase